VCKCLKSLLANIDQAAMGRVTLAIRADPTEPESDAAVATPVPQVDAALGAEPSIEAPEPELDPAVATPVPQVDAALGAEPSIGAPEPESYPVVATPVPRVDAALGAEPSIEAPEPESHPVVATPVVAIPVASATRFQPTAQVDAALGTVLLRSHRGLQEGVACSDTIYGYRVNVKRRLSGASTGCYVIVKPPGGRLLRSCKAVIEHFAARRNGV